MLRSLLRRKGRAVKVLARGFGGQCADYRPTPEEREPLATGRLLVISAFAAEVPTTRKTALARNRLVLALSAEAVFLHVADGSPLAQLLTEYPARR